MAIVDFVQLASMSTMIKQNQGSGLNLRKRLKLESELSGNLTQHEACKWSFRPEIVSRMKFAMLSTINSVHLPVLRVTEAQEACAIINRTRY
jgi:hypothetical protein